MIFNKTISIGVILSAIWLVGIVTLSVFAPLLPINDPEELDLFSMLATPNGDHFMGTDSLGRDIFSRVIYGGQISLFVGLGSVMIGLLFGSTLGVIAAFYQGRIDTMIMGVMNVMLSFPALILAVAIIGFLGASIIVVISAIGVVFIPAFARIARANTLVYRSKEFVLVARTLGATDLRILSREILPNLIGPLFSYSLVMFAVAILAESSLGFLGLSVPPPAPSWGGMISAERTNLETAVHTILMPGLVMFITVVALNILGEKAQRHFDVRKTVL
ncbi:ABC transporter permease [Aurantivibrio infirmus]